MFLRVRLKKTELNRI